MKRTFLETLLEMDVDMEMDMNGPGNGMNGMNGEEEDKAKTYHDEEEAKRHAKEFLDRAREVLNYNKKPAENGDVADMALKFAKEYHDAICDEINRLKYNGDEKKKPDVDVEVDVDRPSMGM